MSYPLVTVLNSTNYNATGNVDYASIFCSNDSYTVDSMKTWKASSRGVCLVTKVTAAVVISADNIVQAKPYTSSGTAYSKFVIIQTGENAFEVTRRVSAMEDEVPADHQEPTENQK